MARERERRYDSVPALAADLQRFLEDRPVAAVAPTPWYLLGRFLRRRPFTVAAAMAAGLSLAISAGLYVAQARREARRFDEARRLIRTVIFDVQQGMESIPATLPLRRSLLERSLEYLGSVAQDAGREPALLRELGAAYTELARVQGNPLFGNLGDRAGAEFSLKRAQALLHRSQELAPEEPDTWRELARLYAREAEQAEQQADRAAAAAAADKSVAYAERYRAARPQEPAALTTLGLARFVRALTLPAEPWQPRVEEFLAAGALHQQAYDRDPALTASLRTVGNTERRVAEILNVHDDHAGGLEHVAKALDISGRLLEQNAQNVAVLLDRAADFAVLGEIHDGLREYTAAAAAYRRSIEFLERAAALDPDNTRVPERLAISMRYYADALLHAGQPRTALAAARRSVELFGDIEQRGLLTPVRRPSAAWAWRILGDAERGAGSPAAACAAYRTAADRFRSIGPGFPDWKQEAEGAWQAAAACLPAAP